MMWLSFRTMYDLEKKSSMEMDGQHGGSHIRWFLNVNPKPSVVPSAQKTSIKGVSILTRFNQDLTTTALFVTSGPQIRGSNVDHSPIRGWSTTKGAAWYELVWTEPSPKAPWKLDT